MIGVGCGLSSEGFIPYVHTFGPFATRRVYDQIYLSVHMHIIQSIFMVQIQDLQ